MDKNVRIVESGKSGQGSSPKKWVTPALRKLPIAATASGGTFNEGVGKGKGNSGPNPTS
jgi:hypothetical protein